MHTTQPSSTCNAWQSQRIWSGMNLRQPIQMQIGIPGTLERLQDLRILLETSRRHQRLKMVGIQVSSQEPRGTATYIHPQFHQPPISPHIKLHQYPRHGTFRMGHRSSCIGTLCLWGWVKCQGFPNPTPINPRLTDPSFWADAIDWA